MAKQEKAAQVLSDQRNQKEMEGALTFVRIGMFGSLVFRHGLKLVIDIVGHKIRYRIFQAGFGA
jgi:hypothetical protein